MTAVVESRMGAVAWGLWPTPRFPSRSSNRTCRFPAFGFPTGFTERHTESNHRTRHLRSKCLSFDPRHSSLGRRPSFDGVLRLIANHHDLAMFESAPEVRALCSAGVTRPQRSYDPVRLPP